MLNRRVQARRQVLDDRVAGRNLRREFLRCGLLLDGCVLSGLRCRSRDGLARLVAIQDSRARSCEELAHGSYSCGVARAGAQEPGDFGWQVTADAQHAKTMSVEELEARVRILQPFPRLPRAEVPLANVGVVHQDDTALAHQRAPRLEIVRRRLGCMTAVDMQQVNAAFGEVRGGLIERRANQRRKCRIPSVVMGLPVRKDGLIVEACLRVALPGVDGVSCRVQTEVLHGLRKGAVRVSRVGAELHEYPRSQDVNHPKRERDVLEPGRRINDSVRFEEDARPQERWVIAPVWRLGALRVFTQVHCNFSFDGRVGDRRYCALNLRFKASPPRQPPDELTGGVVWIDVGRVDHEVRVVRDLIRIRNASELWQLAGPGLGVEPFRVPLLADLERRATRGRGQTSPRLRPWRAPGSAPFRTAR